MDIRVAEPKIRALIDAHMPGCKFVWTRAVKQFGHCRYRNGRVEHIAVSRPLTLANDWTVVRNTVLHELAHALVGPGHHHDYVWKRKARELGCSDERCYNNGRDGLVVNTVALRYTMYCEKCGDKLGYRARRSAGASYTHRGCGGKVKFVLTEQDMIEDVQQISLLDLYMEDNEI